MTFSPLTKRTITTSGKSSSRRGTRITRVNLHHWASTAGAESRMVDPNADVSTNYLVLSNGDIIGQVPEEERAWTSGSWAADAPAITIETQNANRHVERGDDSNPKSWPVTDAAYKSVIQLLADIAKRYKWGGVGNSNLKGHRDFVQTSCPGGFLWSRMSNIRSSANSVVKGNSPAMKPPTPSKKPAPSKPASSKQMKAVKGKGWAFNLPSPRVQKRVQQGLRNRNRYSGPVDGAFGPNTIKGVQISIRNVGYTGPIDGIPGPNTCYFTQIYAKRFGRYVGPVDKVLGPNTWAGFALGLELP